MAEQKTDPTDVLDLVRERLEDVTPLPWTAEFCEGEAGARHSWDVWGHDGDGAAQCGRQSDAEYTALAVNALAPLVEFADAAQKRAGAWPDKLAAEGYVFEHVPSSDPQVKKDHPFEHLAFWLYTDLARIANEAEQALADLQEQLQEKAGD